MVLDFIGNAFVIWAKLIIFPFLHADLLWRMLPIYLNGILMGIYTRSKNDFYKGAIFGGVVSILAGIDWIRASVNGDVAFSLLNWVIAICFCVYGLFSAIVGLVKKRQFYFIFGRRSIFTFFAISFYPIQTGFIYNVELNVIASIFIVALPAILIFELIVFFLRKILYKEEDY